MAGFRGRVDGNHQQFVFQGVHFSGRCCPSRTMVQWKMAIQAKGNTFNSRAHCIANPNNALWFIPLTKIHRHVFTTKFKNLWLLVISNQKSEYTYMFPTCQIQICFSKSQWSPEKNRFQPQPKKALTFFDPAWKVQRSKSWNAALIKMGWTRHLES